MTPWLNLGLLALALTAIWVVQAYRGGAGIFPDEAPRRGSAGAAVYGQGGRGHEVLGETLQPPDGRRPIPTQLDINRATARDFESLPGIGRKLSLAIIEFREEHGQFQSPEDLRAVKGIGEKRYSAIADLIAVSAAMQEAPPTGHAR